MKNILFLLFFLPFVFFGQKQTTVVGVKSSTKIVNQRELVLSEKKITVNTPLTVDLNNYTHILIVKAATSTSLFPKLSFNKVATALSSSIFEIWDPHKYDKKRFKKEGKSYLKTVKDESYLYLYYTESKGKGDDKNTSIILRDFKNKVIYNASHINSGIDEVFSPITGF